MKRLVRILLLLLCAAVLMASSPASPAWRMKADYVEACSCMAFCPCYFNKQAQHPYCEFNMAVQVREGRSGNVNLAGAKYWLTGDLGDNWGNNKAKWVVVSFDPSTTPEQRNALAPMILETYGMQWSELRVQEAPIEINRTADIAEAKLAGGQQAYMKLQRVPGSDGKGVMLRNVDYFGAQSNDGFAIYKSIEHRADLDGGTGLHNVSAGNLGEAMKAPGAVQPHKFKYTDRNAFLISIDTSSEGRAAKAKAGGM